MNKIIILWDIENIHFEIGLKKLEGISASKKIFVHNDKNIPLKQDKRNYLLNREWEFFPVKNKRNAADSKIISLIEKYFNDYESFVILTQDHGFSNIISKLLNSQKNVILITDEKYDKLINKIEKKAIFIENLLIK